MIHGAAHVSGKESVGIKLKPRIPLIVRITSFFRSASSARSAAMLCLFAVVPCSAQTHVTATFKTPENKTPLAAQLKISATIAATSVYGSVDFVPFAASGTSLVGSATRIICSGITYVPQNARAWIKADGVLISSAGTPGIDLIPTVGCTPSGLYYRATITLSESGNGRRPGTKFEEKKQIPSQANVDWGSLNPE